MSNTMRFQHVANGHATTRMFQEAGIPGAPSVWADVLYEGPVPGGVSDEQLMGIRARHHAGADWTEEQVFDETVRWRQAIDQHSTYDELVLWYEHDLFDQLNLLQVLSRIRHAVADVRPVSLICIGSFPGRDRFHGLGELTPGELATLFPLRQPVGDPQYSLAERAWDAFREPDPSALEAIVHAGTPALPYLAPALRRLFEEYPWTTDGLSRTERRLLQLAAAGPLDLGAVFPRMHDLELAFYITDNSFTDLVRGLASCAPPLLTMTVRPDEAASLQRGQLALTETGMAALAGLTDRVHTYGIDRWLGGVHLEGTGPVWRWNPQKERLVRA